MKNLRQIQRKKLILKSRNLWSVSKTSHTKWPCLPVATITEPEALDTFQRDISFQNQNPLPYIKSYEWLINWAFDSIDNFKAEQIHQIACRRPWSYKFELLKLISSILSYQFWWDIELKSNFCKAILEITITHLIPFSKKPFGFYQPSIKY